MTLNDFAQMYSSYHEDPRSIKDSMKDVKTLFRVLRDMMVENEKVSISGIGTFDTKVVTVPETTRYIPATGKMGVCKEHRTVRAHFKPCKELKEAIFLAQE